MIKLRVEWRQECPGCGTELASDFLDSSVRRATCPWCGCDSPLSAGPDSAELREFLAGAVSEIEAKANGGIKV